MKNHKKSLLPTLLCCIAIASFIISYSFAERCEAKTIQKVISELSLSIQKQKNIIL